MLPMAAIIMEIKFDFFFIFKQERIRSLAKRSIHSLWLAFSFQFWLKGPWKYVCSLSNNDNKGVGEREWGERKEGARCCHCILFHLPSAPANSVQYRALSPRCSALPGCSPFGIESCFPLQSRGLGSHSLLVEVVFVPSLNLCTCASLLAQLSCFSLLLVEARHFTAAQMNQMHG